MSGAYAVHKKIRNELEEYIKSQYFGKTPILLNEVGSQIDKEGILYQRPYIESSPAYRTVPEGIKNSVLPEWLKGYFQDLIDSNEEFMNRWNEYNSDNKNLDTNKLNLLNSIKFNTKAS